MKYCIQLNSKNKMNEYKKINPKQIFCNHHCEAFSRYFRYILDYCIWHGVFEKKDAQNKMHKNNKKINILLVGQRKKLFFFH